MKFWCLKKVDCGNEALIIHLSLTQTVYTLTCGINNTRHITWRYTELTSVVVPPRQAYKWKSR